ncbi:MAG: Fic family protein [Planctomycetota bacterium]
MRAGHYVKQGQGDFSYRAFIPEPLPPDPPVQIDGEMARLLSSAERALGKLDGVSMILPNPDLFLGMYVRQEAVLSSQIEGTQSTLEDVLRFEAGEKGQDEIKDVAEVVNYVAAMNYGLNRLGKLPLSLRLIREIHEKLLTGVRGGERTPGEFRRSQNWIGPKGCTLARAAFVPPPVHEMQQALDNLEKFLHERDVLPPLIHCGLAHAQFETIHPFLDGNGRVGRLLITFLLCEQKILSSPLLYLSLYLKTHRQEYYDRLMAVRTDGNWESWLKFFLRGVQEVSASATATAKAIIEIRDRHRTLVSAKAANAAASLKLLDYMFEHPMLTVRMVEQHLACVYATANNLVGQFEALGLLKEMTGGQRNRRYRYESYLALFEALNAAKDTADSDEKAGS